MTNEEVQDLYERTIGQDVVDSFRATDRLRAHAGLAEAILKFGRELVAQAYEEAIQIAAGWDSASNGNHARSVADDIRELKDSLSEVHA